MGQPTEVDACIQGLESQLAELKAIIYGATDAPTTNSSSPSTELSKKDKEIEELKAENKKLQYRIMTLVRTVGEKRAIINELNSK
ncbi:hypothetical protein HDU79_001884 [Rhizoclosmatium sp. JEL0117]|nr:hypothetical protein HDU79_001884 [Rhizoclosmatium sp. JEL0117]